MSRISSRLLPRLAAALLLAAGGCHSIQPYLDELEGREPRHYVVVAPEARFSRDSVRRFLVIQRIEHDVRLVTFSTDVDMPLRHAEVRQKLRDNRPPEGELGYVLFLATTEELSMGPWQLEGAPEPVRSDVPLLLDSPGVPLSARDLQKYLDPSFPWIAGRLPFRRSLLDRALAHTGRIFPAGYRPLAMIGAERHAVWADASLIMDAARTRFERRGWRTVTYADDWPGDVHLGPHDAAHRRTAADTAARLSGTESDLNDPVIDPIETAGDYLFFGHWRDLAPDVVFLNAHGNTEMIGEHLLHTGRAADHIFGRELSKLSTRPARPAVVLNLSCSGASAGSELQELLFRYGFACAVVGSNENIAPVPLLASIEAEIDCATALASDLPLGLSYRATLRRYHLDARNSVEYLLLPSVRWRHLRNMFSMTLYGDPSLAMPGGRSPRPLPHR